MNLPPEEQVPFVACVSSFHQSPVRASWRVDTLGYKGSTYCSSCHFLVKRSEEIFSEIRIPVSTMIVDLPGNLGVYELYAEIEEVKREAQKIGYWSDRSLYDIVNLEGKVRLTFRKP